MPGRTIAIGDIHGCATALAAVLNEIAPAAEDVLIPLGDVIDRGPNSRQVIEQLLVLNQQCDLRPVLGNHEEMLLEVLEHGTSPHSWIQWGGAATLDSYGFLGSFDIIPEQHVQFLRSFHDCVETDTHFFVHANYDPLVPLIEQLARTLRWTSLDEQVPGQHVSGKIAIVGHTAERSGEIFSLRHLKCIDTYCHGGGWLTALDVISGRIWQSNEKGQLRKS